MFLKLDRWLETLYYKLPFRLSDRSAEALSRKVWLIFTVVAISLTAMSIPLSFDGSLAVSAIFWYMLSAVNGSPLNANMQIFVIVLTVLQVVIDMTLIFILARYLKRLNFRAWKILRAILILMLVGTVIRYLNLHETMLSLVVLALLVSLPLVYAVRRYFARSDSSVQPVLGTEAPNTTT